MTRKTLKAKAIIFDMDGVITNTMPDHFAAWKAALWKEGVHVTHEDIYCREGQPGFQSMTELLTHYKKEFDDRTIKRILKEKEEHFKNIVKLRFITGARRLLKELARESFILGLVTGTSRHEVMNLLPPNIYQLFSVIITGNDVKIGKPHPEPYLKSLDQLNLKAKDAIVIENAPFGIQSAKEAGLRCIAIETSLSRKYLKRADLVFKNFKEMKESLDLILC